MHIPTSSLRRSSKSSEVQEAKEQKRKASDTSAASVDAKPARKKLSKDKAMTKDDASEEPKRSISLRKPNKKKSKSPLFQDEEQEELPTSPQSQRANIERDSAVVTKRSDSVEPQEQTPRRSSRIKESMSKCSEAWDKCRPYIERINGTFMPIESKTGPKAYYRRDGVET